MLAHRRVGGLQRVVPVAVAVGGQRRAGIDALARSARARARACCQTVARSPASGARASKNGTRSSSTPASPDGDQILRRAPAAARRRCRRASRRARMSRSRSKNMNHCGQSPSAFCCAHHAQQQVAHRLDAAEREQQLDRALADVARAPAAAGVLLEAARREVVHERVVREPGHDVGDARRACSAERCRRAAPSSTAAAASALGSVRRAAGLRVLRDQAAPDAQADRRRRAR